MQRVEMNPVKGIAEVAEATTRRASLGRRTRDG